MIKSRVIMPEINQEFDVQYNENAQVCDVITDTLDVVSQYLRTGYVNREHWALVLPREGMVMDPDRTLKSYHVENGDKLILM